MSISITISIIISLLIGVVIGRFLLQMLLKKQEKEASEKAKGIIKEAENQAEHVKKQRQLEAKEKFLQLKAEHEKEVSQRNNTIVQKENSIRQKEQSLNQKLENINREKQELDAKNKRLDQMIEFNQKKQEEVDQLKNQHIKHLETIAGLSADEAKEQLITSLKEEARSQAVMQIKDIVDEAKLTASKEAKALSLCAASGLSNTSQWRDGSWRLKTASMNCSPAAMISAYSPRKSTQIPASFWETSHRLSPT